MFSKQVLKQILRRSTTAAHNLKAAQQQNVVEVGIDGNLVVVKQPNGNSMKFPGVWLRDNCQCDACYHALTKSRTINWERSNIGINVESVSVAESGITIDWNDRHRSTFNLNWLTSRDFAPENRQRYTDQIYKPAHKLWAKEDFKTVLKNFEYHAVLKNDDVLLAWLEALAVQGFAMIKNTPKDEKVVRHLANRIGFIKRTTYGEEFEVKAKKNAKNYAYHMTPLPLHTDMPYYEYKAGINILHCLVQTQSKGGENLMTDGFYIADRMRREYPAYFDILLQTPVDWYDIGNDSDLAFHNIWRSPVIILDIDGAYHRVNHNATKRDSHFTVPLELVMPWYEAYDKFLELSNAEAIEFKTMPGDVFVFNNLRMLHGRTAFEDSTDNHRHLIGAYVDWDIIYSKMRILRSRQKETQVSMQR